MKIEINGVQISLEFNYKTLRILAELLGLKYVQEVFSALSDFGGREIDFFVTLVLACVRASGNDTITEDQVGDWVLSNMAELPKISAALQSVLPQPEPDDAGNVAALPVTGAEVLSPKNPSTGTDSKQ